MCPSLEFASTAVRQDLETVRLIGVMLRSLLSCGAAAANVLGLQIARARRAILTPGYQLPLLRSWRIVVMKQNFGVSQDVFQKENSDTQRFPKPDGLPVLAYAGKRIG
jgi:hypothetical protein